MKTLIRRLYNIFFTLFLAFLLFSILVYTIHFFSSIVPKWNCVYNKLPVKIESYDRGSFGEGGEVDYSIGQFGTKKIKIDGVLQLDSVYLVWNCDKDNISYLVSSKEETVKQFKNRRLFARIKFLVIIISINISLFGLSYFFGRLMKKYKISNKAD